MPRPLRRPHRFEIQLSDREMEALEELRLSLGLPAKTDVFRKALASMWTTHLSEPPKA
jgi:hypothetical protein